MRQKMKQLMGILLSLVMVLGLMPGMSLTAYADDPYASLKNTTTVVQFDSKDWYLINYDSTTVTLLAKECVGKSQYNARYNDGSVRFVAYESNPTVKTTVDKWYEDNITADAKTAVSGNAMFLLTKEEVNAITNADVRKCTNAHDGRWWLCSPGNGNHGEQKAAYVNGESGDVIDSPSFYVTRAIGVRPALKLNLSSVIFESGSKTFKKSVVVTFDKQSGTGGSESVQPVSGKDMPSATMPTRTGYTFGGYYTGKNGSGTQYYTVDGKSAKKWDKTTSLTLYAKWTGKTSTVTLNKQSGTGGSDSVTATYGSSMPSATMPTRTGYTFGGYYTSTNGGGTQYYKADGTSAKSWDKTAATTLYAKWTVLTSSVTLNMQSGTGGTDSVTATYGSAMPSATMPTRAGYDFQGYYDATSGGNQYYTAAGKSARSWNKTEAATLYARWKAHKFTVKFNGNGSTSGSMANQSFTYGTATALSANSFSRSFTVSYQYNGADGGNTISSAPANATFNGWATSATGEKVYNNAASVSDLTATDNGTVDLYAKWTDGSVTLPTPTKDDCVLEGWYSDSALTNRVGNGGVSYTPSANITLYAKWTSAEASVTPSGGTATNYSTVTDAVTAWNNAANGATLKLLTDVTIDSSIQVSGTKTLDLNGYGITYNGEDPSSTHKNASVIQVEPDCILTMKDSSQSRSTHYYYLDASGLAHVVASTDDEKYQGADKRGSFTGGYITGGKGTLTSGACGGGVHVYGKFIMQAGTIIGNSASNGTASDAYGLGGGVRVQDLENGLASFEMSGGMIIGNRSDSYGAGIHMNGASGTCTISGGKIINNTGEGVYGSGIAFWNASTFTLSGSPTITGNSPTDIYLNSGKVLTVASDLNPTSPISVKLRGTVVTRTFTTGANFESNAAAQAVFTSTDPGYYVTRDNSGNAQLSTSEANAVASVTDSSGNVAYYTAFEGNDATTDALAAWSTGSTLTLLKNVATTKTIEVPTGDHTLDLNGYGIKATMESGRVMNVPDGANLILNDSRPTATTNKFTVNETTQFATLDNANGTLEIHGGYITGGTGDASYSCGGAILLYGTMTMNGGTIIGNKAGYRGGAIEIEQKTVASDYSTTLKDSSKNITFRMTGGCIRNNAAISNEDNAGYGVSGAINITKGKYLMTGGAIINNYASMGGGAIQVASNLNNDSAFFLQGGEISGNKAGRDGGAFSVWSGDASSTSYVCVSGGLVSNNVASTIVSSRGGGGFIVAGQGTSELDITGGVISNNRVANSQLVGGGIAVGNAIGLNNSSDSDNNLILNITGNPTITGNTVNGVPEEVYLKTGDMLWGMLSDNANKLPCDVTVGSTITVSDTKTLDLNGYGIKAATSDSKKFRVIDVQSNGTLNFQDSGNIRHYYYIDSDGLAHVVASENDTIYTSADDDKKGSFTGGYITGGHVVGNNGAGIRIKSDGTLNMTGGTIIGNYAEHNSAAGGGGGVNNNGVFEMSNGAILGNKANTGGGVENLNHFTMNGGKIIKNTANITGGISNTGTDSDLKIYGGAITDNVGNGIYNQGTLELKGEPVIKDNTGYNVYLETNKNITVTGALSNTTPISVKMQTPGKITDGTAVTFTDTTAAQCFVSEDTNFIVKAENGQAKLTKPTYTLTVENGVIDTGSASTGEYPEGASVTINANAPDEGKVFKEWTGTAVTITSGSAATSSITFTMPAHEVTLTAVYQDLISYGIKVGDTEVTNLNIHELLGENAEYDPSTNTVTINDNLSLTENMVVKNGSKLEIASGKKITIPENKSVTIEQGGSLENNGTIDGLGAVNNDGTFENNGTTESNVNITNSGTVENNGSGSIKGPVTNSGTFDNGGSVSGSVTNDNGGTLNNLSGATITGTVTNQGTIDNSGTISGNVTNKTGGVLNNQNTGAINGEVNNESGATLNNQPKGEDEENGGTITGRVTNGGTLNNGGTISGDVTNESGAKLNNETGGTLSNVDNSGEVTSEPGSMPGTITTNNGGKTTVDEIDDDGNTTKITTTEVDDQGTEKVTEKNEEGNIVSETTTTAGEAPVVKHGVIVSGTEIGTVTADKVSAAKDETVTLTITHDYGYKLASVWYQTPDGAVTTIEGTSFTMPDDSVVVSASFAMDSDQLPAPKEQLFADGTPKALVSAPVTPLPEGYTIKYAVTTIDTTPTDESVYSDTIPTGTDAGTYYVWYKVVKGEEVQYQGRLMVEIAMKKSIVITANSAEVKYGGNEHQVSGFVTDTFEVDGNTYTVSGLTASGKGTDVGTYTVSVSGTAVVKDSDGNDVSNEFSVTHQTGTLTIGKRSVILTSATDSKAYDGTALTNNTVTVSGDGFAEGEGASYNVTGTQTLPGESTNAFTFILNEGTNANNYTIDKSEGNLTITGRTEEGENKKYEITVTANSGEFLYDGAEHSVSGLKETQFTFNGVTYTVSGLSAEANGTNAGEYTATVTGTAVVKDSADNVLTDQFIINTVDGKLKINKRNVTLTSASDTKEYDGDVLTNNGVTVSGDGFAEGEGASYNVTGSQKVVGNSANSFTYTLNEGTKADNYNITKVEGTLSVTSRDAKYGISPQANSVEVKYDGKEHKVSGFVTDTFVVEGNTYTVSGLTASAAGTDVGEYTVNVSGTAVVLDSDNSDVSDQFSVTPQTGTLTINKRSVTMTSATDSKEYDGDALTNNGVTVTGEGFVEGEGATYDVTGTRTLVGTSDNSFTYTLKDNTKADNYNISTSFGTLTINNRNTKYNVTLAADSMSVKYDGKEKNVSGYTIDGNSSEQTEYGMVTGFTASNGQTYTIAGMSASVSGTDAGEYTANVIGTPTIKDSNGNDVTEQFAVNTESGKLTIQKRSIILTSQTDSKAYDGTALTNDTVTVGGDGFAEGEGVSYNVTGTQTLPGESTNAFTFILNEGTAADNYTITKSEGKLTVKARTADGSDKKYEITVEANSGERTYDGTEHSISGLKETQFTFNGVTYTVSGLSAEANGTNAGEYTATVTGTAVVKDSADNVLTDQFIINTVDGKLKINKRNVTLTSASDTKEYDGDVLTNNGVTVSGDGFAEGEGATYTVTGSRTRVGTEDNTFTYTLKDNTKVDNYNITTSFGVLTVIRNEQDKSTFDVEKTTQKTEADELERTEDSAASKKLIEDAKAAIDTLEYDDSKTIEENKDALDAIVTKLKKEVEKQRAIDEQEAETEATIKVDQGDTVAKVDTEKIAEKDVAVVEEVAKNTNADLENAAINQVKEIVKECESVEDGDKNIVIVPSLEVKAEDYVVSTESATITLDIEAVYTSYETASDITTAADVESAASSDDESTKAKVKKIGSGKLNTEGTPVDVMIEVPEAFAQALGATTGNLKASPKTVFVKHTHNGRNYEYNGRLYYSDVKYYAEFTNPNGFSPFTLSGNSSSVATFNGKNYTDLQSAIDDVADGSTITMINDDDVTVTVKTEKSFTIDKDGHTGKVDIKAADDLLLTMTENEDGTITYKTDKKYTLTFNPNGGTGTMAAQDISGTATLNANTFTREGYAFDGWNTKTDGSGTAYADKANVTLTEDMTLYAQWKENPKSDDKESDEKTTDDKTTNDKKSDDKITDVPKTDGTLEAAKKTADDKLDNVVAKLKKIIDSLTNLSADKKEELKKQIDKAAADSKNVIDSATSVEAVEAEYQKAIEAVKAILTNAIKSDIESQIAAAKKAIDNNSGLTDKQKKDLKDSIDSEVKKVLGVLGTTVDKIAENAVKGTSTNADPTKENKALVKEVMDKVAEIIKETKTDAKVEAAANIYATPEKVRKNEININMKLKVEQVGRKINISWGKVKDADGYQVYVQYCGKKFAKPVKTIKKNSTTKMTVTKIGGKKLNLKKNYKVVVRAYKNVSGKKLKIGNSITAHIVGVKNKKYTNVKEVKVTNHTVINVGKGSTHKIKAKTVLVDKSKKQLSNAHAKQFRYVSADPEIATVDSKGVITGKKAGKTIIYVFARNGYAKEIKVTVP